MFKRIFKNVPILSSYANIRFVSSKSSLHNDFTLPQKSSQFSMKTHLCGELNEDHVGEEVSLCGWVSYLRGDRFLILNDYAGSVQVLLKHPTKSSDLLPNTQKLPLESVVQVKGSVIRRPHQQINKSLKTGSIEVVAEDLQILNTCSHLPFQIQDFFYTNEDSRLKFRYLDLRRNQMQSNLRLRSKIISNFRSFLEDLNFVEIETPTLYKFTPGGANEFLVPSSVSPGLCYSLPQSPQLLKQLLMVGGFDRYFQIARCYRNDSLNANRQFEFTQLDIEMSFVNQDHIMDMVQNMVIAVWPRPLHPQSFCHMTYEEAMTSYGIDKPDIRFEAKLEDLGVMKTSGGDDVIAQLITFTDCLNVFDQLEDSLLLEIKSKMSSDCKIAFVLRHKDGRIEIRSNHQEVDQLRSLLGSAPHDSLQIVCWSKDQLKVSKNLGVLRKITGDVLNQHGALKMSSDGDAFVWITEFPLFEISNDQMVSVHHPFTAPHPEDTHKLYSDPLSVRSLAYDLVLNGEEVAGGSIRIHDPQMQESVLKDLLQIDPHQFSYLIDALSSGAPPHGGIAFGLDRIFAILCNADSIRDVIAFPKNSVGKDVMAGAPSVVTRQQALQFAVKFDK